MEILADSFRVGSVVAQLVFLEVDFFEFKRDGLVPCFGLGDALHNGLFCPRLLAERKKVRPFRKSPSEFCSFAFERPAAHVKLVEFDCGAEEFLLAEVAHVSRALPEFLEAAEERLIECRGGNVFQAARLCAMARAVGARVVEVSLIPAVRVPRSHGGLALPAEEQAFEKEGVHGLGVSVVTGPDLRGEAALDALPEFFRHDRVVLSLGELAFAVRHDAYVERVGEDSFDLGHRQR